MGKTIIQTIGPLYGEAINGTVFGRPNGSIYVPPTNTISLSVADNSLYVRNFDPDNSNLDTVLCDNEGTFQFGNAGNTIVAESQDIASNIITEISASADFTTYAGYSYSAGRFNIGEVATVANPTVGTLFEIENGTTYYLRAVLMNNGEPVAVSDVIELTGWASE